MLQLGGRKGLSGVGLVAGRAATCIPLLLGALRRLLRLKQRELDGYKVL
jgi:hypothetical protein